MWKGRNELSLGIFVAIARNFSYHLRYSPWISSLRWVVVWEGRVALVSLKWCSILHALDHQANLEAMAFWVLTAFARRGWAIVNY